MDCQPTAGFQFLLALEKLENLENERTFFSQGKVREFQNVTRKSGESQGIFYQSGKSQGKLDQKTIELFHVASLKTVVSRHSFVKDLFHIGKNVFSVSECWKNHKNTGKVREKSRNFVIGKVGTLQPVLGWKPLLF